MVDWALKLNYLSSVSSLVAPSVLSFFIWLFFSLSFVVVGSHQKFLQYFSLRDRLFFFFCMALIEQVGDRRYQLAGDVAYWYLPLCIYICFDNIFSVFVYSLKNMCRHFDQVLINQTEWLVLPECLSLIAHLAISFLSTSAKCCLREDYSISLLLKRDIFSQALFLQPFMIDLFEGVMAILRGSQVSDQCCCMCFQECVDVCVLGKGLGGWV